ncbi:MULTISPECIES: alpha/beta hydrolase-fold protein [unclassified Paenibacillus]|uniref:alpha/beta hydrolase n=1 Tax=unclassified Paenibacillus TaxID=185978 RepID=UPI001AE69D27|nr:MULTISPECIES: alpha/beta hydrolase-fold protein [unclassified Paenibacillus]MBP1153319.1 phospholipase/carboxylesterase [Paenibacillus sp. PvP091]MBP1171298.1 phospholipase/carboxylesterase [Paenibacillus sp. PvR098]MBP2442326.1 phospholipase/carboxylesterase [Paenibacillus sp. PvP052]
MSAHYKYEVILPQGYNPVTKYPVIFAMHGKGSNELNMIPLLDGLKEDFIVISIRGDLPLGSGYAYFHIKSIGNPIRELFDQAVQRLEQFMGYATNKYAIDPARRYLLGFSQGAILSMSLALVMGEQIKGIVALNGYIPSFVKNEYPIQTVKKLSVFISHGEFDPIFPRQLGDDNHDYLRQVSDHVTYRTYAAGHEVTLENKRDFTIWLQQNAMTITS